MGVTGLWTVVQPCARPIKIETLNRKRLAVDASIWIYQFLKAVRDKEGNALRNSHVVGFFRRICKLLFYGIKPVFVFDGGAPALKRQTINNRKRTREGRREDAVRTAGKLLALQMQRRAEEEERKRKEAQTYGHHAEVDDEGPLPENLMYVDEIHMTPQERQQNRTFKKKDQYHLPDLEMSLAEMGGPNDPRIMSLEELEQYARQFDDGEDINLYDFSKIDFDSPFFQSLPDADRYNILNAARIRSRLRMGYSKEQLDTMFPDRMAFSKFQIERVRERNELTQRLMHITGLENDGTWGPNSKSRVAGEKNREYVLVKNEGAEGGWALGVVSSKDEGERDKPIDVERLQEPDEDEDDEWEDEDEFEDVPIEGLNRLPKPKPQHPVPGSADTPQLALIKDMAQRRQALYSSRRQEPSKRTDGSSPRRELDSSDSLFVADGPDEDGNEWENVDGPQTDDEEAELQRAIAMSLQNDDEPMESADEEDDYREVFQQSRVDDAKPFTKGGGLAIARVANARSSKAANQPATTAISDEEEDVDLQAALVESRRSKRKQSPPRANISKHSSPPPKISAPANSTKSASLFDGPLPFEKLELGSSLLGKKKTDKVVEESEGGFVKDGRKKKQDAPLPPWFSGKLQEDLANQKTREEEERMKEDEDLFSRSQRQIQPKLRKAEANEIIDLEAPTGKSKEIITIDDAFDEEDEATATQQVTNEGSGVLFDEVAENIRAEPPQLASVQMEASQPDANETEESDEELEWEESDGEEKQADSRVEQPQQSASPEFEDVPVTSASRAGLKMAPGKPPAPKFESIPTDKPVIEDDARQEMPDGDLEDEDLYSDPEDEALFQSLAAEAEEHARFASTLNNKSVAENAMDYERELKQLRNQQKKDRRDADEVTQTMISECQQLLTLFGLPYITAPMEAEAQCAELVSLGLVDGIVTDDSDIFLFGGTRVYKNMFNQAKFVECYLAPDLSNELGLDREKLIAIAQLLGSDYTEGLPGVGPVTALEILSEFGSLAAFREWWTAVQTGALPPSADNPPGGAASASFRRKFRRAHATKLFLPPAFPDPRVAEAYLRPEVDSDASPFQWGVPDLEALRNFLMATIGWSRERTDEVLVPVIRDMNRREEEGTQSNITAFFGGAVGAGGFAPRRREAGGSKRLMGALGRMKERTQEVAAGGEEDDGDVEGTAAKRKVAAKANPSTPVGTVSDPDDEYKEPRKKARRGTKGKAKR